MLSDEKAIGLSNTTLWKNGRHYIFNNGPSKGWSVGFKTGSNYLSFFTSILFELVAIFFFIMFILKKILSHKGGSQELPLNGKNWKHDGNVQPAHVECMEVCKDHKTILPKGTSSWNVSTNPIMITIIFLHWPME